MPYKLGYKKKMYFELIGTQWGGGGQSRNCEMST